ncbi:hypothetical protein ACS0TY_000614 [Phlomoides rotata]
MATQSSISPTMNANAITKTTPEIYVKVVVARKVPLPNYWPGLDDKRPQRGRTLRHICSQQLPKTVMQPRVQVQRKHVEEETVWLTMSRLYALRAGEHELACLSVLVRLTFTPHMQPTVAKGSDVISGSDLEDEFPFDLNDNYKSEKVPVLPFIPEEEEMSVEELERMLGERYKPVSGFVTCAEDGYEQKETCMCHLPWIQQSGKSNER